MTLSPWSGRSALRADAVERSGAQFADLAARFAAEWAEPSVVQLSGRQHDFQRHAFDGPDSVALSRPPRFGVKKCLELCQ